ncbi:hypothetical protein [Brumicola nitratireducens]|uniref:PEP-CTERM protein-sorting domain-containing protein n=1 Tax=Glaciecola nitratireducens (strain JCM 12485 / KCTC 12276 / FR1064) TaxID=1085623 RepID=G4QKL9_GLANF|nr:hypothetical protein [Glaciecola nitratireducens]AEP30085.1 hypothetical protein GNIT_1976 [Glaciecola nitratireducens FR1064]
MEVIQASKCLSLKVLIIAGCTLITSFGASAGIIYESVAEFELTSINVTSAGGGAGGGSGSGGGPGNASSYEITLLTTSTFDTFIASTGDGDASFYTELQPFNLNWAIGDEFYQYSESIGEAGFSVSANGTADSRAATDFSMSFANTSNGSRLMTFELLFSSFVSTYLEFTGLFDSREDGGSYAEIYLVDSAFPNDFLFFSSVELFAGGALFDDIFLEDSLSFTLGAGESKTIYGSTYTEGYATAVPEPSVLWTMSAGVLGLFGLRIARHVKNGQPNLI